MSLPAGFIQHFESIDLVDPPTPTNITALGRRHLINIEYPCRELIPGGYSLHIDLPSNVQYRQQPPQRPSVPEELDSYFYFWNKEHSCVPSAPINGRVQDFLSLMRQIGGSSGKTTLSVVRYFSLAGISTKIVVDIDDELACTEEFIIDEEQWQALMSISIKADWIALIRHLVYRESDRAYYCVQNRLTDYSEQLAWNTQAPRSVKEIFLSKFSMPNLFEAAQYYTTQVSANSRTLKLPCGCLTSIDLDTLNNLTDADYQSQRCKECRAPILSRDDLRETQLSQAKVEAESFLQSNQQWTALDTPISTQQLDIKGGEFRDILHVTLNSFRAPSLICPSLLLYPNLEETRVALSELDKIISANKNTIISGPKFDIAEKYLRSLYDTHLGTGIRCRTAPGFWQFVRLWLIRAVKFSIQRRCQLTDEHHRGFHAHEDGVRVYGSGYFGSEQLTEAFAQMDFEKEASEDVQMEDDGQGLGPLVRKRSHV